jgi:hypothetical protein
VFDQLICIPQKEVPNKRHQIQKWFKHEKRREDPKKNDFEE